MNKEQFGYNADDRESASVAHIYGQNLAAAESMTAAAAPWAWSPATLKPTADQELLNGINRFVIHESAHQPLVGKAPGLTLGPFGQWFNRNETWAEQARAVDRLPGAHQFPAAAGPFRRRRSLLLRRGLEPDRDLRQQVAGRAGRIWLRLRQRRRADPRAERGRTDSMHHQERDELRSAGARSLQPAHVASCAARHSQAGGGRARWLRAQKPTDDPSLADDQAEFTETRTTSCLATEPARTKVGKGTVYAGQSLAEVLAADAMWPRTLTTPSRTSGHAA